MMYSAKQMELMAAHGTPDEFEAACWRASNDLMITDAEAIAGIQKYRQEFAEASDHFDEWIDELKDDVDFPPLKEFIERLRDPS